MTQIWQTPDMFGDLFGGRKRRRDQAKHLLSQSRTADDVAGVEQVVTDSRCHRAAVVALRDGEPLPQRRLAAGEAPLERLVRVGDRWVPWHLSVGAWGVSDAASNYLAQGHGHHVQAAIAEAYIGSPGGMPGGGNPISI